MTDIQRDFLNKHGYIQFKNFLPPETVAEFIGVIEKVQNYLIENDISKIKGVPVKFGNDINGQTFIQRLAFTAHFGKKLQIFFTASPPAIIVTISGELLKTHRTKRNKGVSSKSLC